MFYEFRQNNSGGVFEHDEKRGIGHYVIVEADDWNDANDKAERIGIYFDGCDNGMDCPCCGDRWSPMWEGTKGDPVPSHYGQPLRDYKDTWGIIWKNDGVFIHYKNGNVDWVKKIQDPKAEGSCFDVTSKKSVVKKSPVKKAVKKPVKKALKKAAKKSAKKATKK